MSKRTTIPVECVDAVRRALGSMIWTLQCINPVFGVGYIFGYDEPEMEERTFYVKLMDGPSATGTVIKEIAASSDKPFGPAFIDDVVTKLEMMIFDLQDWSPTNEEG